MVLDWDGLYYQCVNRCGCTGMHFALAPHSCDAVHREFLPFQYRHAVAGGYFDNWEGPTDEELLSSTPAPPVVQTAVQTPPVAPPVVPTESGRQNKNKIWGGPMRAKASTSSTSTQAPTPAQTPAAASSSSTQAPTPAQTPAAASSFPTLLRLRCDSDTAPTPTQPEQYDWQSQSWQW